MSLSCAEIRDFPVIEVLPQERVQFIRKTYTHLAGAIGVLIVFEFFLFNSSFAHTLQNFISKSHFGWISLLAGFMAVGWLARGFISGSPSRNVQYAGLMVYVVVESILFLPLLHLAVYYSTSDVLPSAALLTGFLFLGLTVVAFTTKNEFSFHGSFLTIAGFVALGLILSGLILGFSIGVFFSGVMIILASMAILCDTSRVLKTHGKNQYVGASLNLFASVALLFWFVLCVMTRVSRE
jgi:FtsH-binding integral membrane protein